MGGQLTEAALQGGFEFIGLVSVSIYLYGQFLRKLRHVMDRLLLVVHQAGADDGNFIFESVDLIHQLAVLLEAGVELKPEVIVLVFEPADFSVYSRFFYLGRGFL
jgi:hypothetical protein